MTSTEARRPKQSRQARAATASTSVVTAIGLTLVGLVVVWLVVNLVKDWSTFLQLSFSGLTRGAMYALVALGYTLVYGILELINFAHGDVFMIGGMIAATFAIRSSTSARTRRSSSLVPAILVSLVAAMIVCGLLNATIERVAYKPLRSAPRLVPLITAIGVAFILENVAFIWKGSAPVSLPPHTLPRGDDLHARRRARSARRTGGISSSSAPDHGPRPARARLARALHEAGEGDAGDRAGQGRRGDDGDRRQPDDLVHLPASPARSPGPPA